MNNKYKLSILTLLSVATLGLSACDNKEAPVKDEAKTESQVEVAEVQSFDGEKLDKIVEDSKEKEKYFIIDVRKPEEYEAGHIKWAVNIPLDDIKDQIDLIKAYEGEKEIITICNTGNQSQKAAEQLIEAGIEPVYNADGVKDYEYKNITQVGYVTGPELQALVDKGDDEYFFVDAREPKDFDKGHLKGAVNIEVADLEEKLDLIPEGKTIVTYCYSGNRSDEIAQALKEKGFEKVINATDGTKEYDGFELVEE